MVQLSLSVVGLQAAHLSNTYAKPAVIIRDIFFIQLTHPC
jgi:hypothetical protein